VAKEAILQSAQFAFAKLFLLRLKILIQENNILSQKTAESVSAKFEGILRNQWCFHEQVIHNVKLYSLIPEDIGLDSKRILLEAK
jgi:RimJ/RimL family protein N-acetyltransferase